MLISELRFYLKRHKVMVMLLYFQATLFLILIGTFSSFIQQLNYESKQLQNIYEGKSIYQLLDDYYDENDYQEFVSQPDYLTRLKNFYNELNQSNDFQYLSMFNQPILMKDNAIPKEMANGYESGSERYQEKLNDEIYTMVKSFQMNEQAFKFFNLKVVKGKAWDKKAFKDSQGILPVLLGNSYEKTYNIGDRVSIYLYEKPITIEIIGFLAADSKIYFNGNSEFYLDKQVLLPYIEYSNPLSDIDEKFQQISYFAMINGYIATGSDSISNQKMMQSVESIAQKVGGFKYSFIGLNPNFQRYRGLMTIIQENTKLIQSIFLLSFLLNILILNLMLVLQQKRRLSFLAIHYLQGCTKLSLVKKQWIEVSIILFSAFLTNYIILNEILKIGDVKVQLYLLGITFIISIIACILPAFKLIFDPILNSLQSEEERRYL